ncbi:MAG: efflux RND transporter periplasmic adaptor subunit [Pirellula sp.]|jgi:membrane fusion protein (multidrug efflux system)
MTKSKSTKWVVPVFGSLAVLLGVGAVGAGLFAIKQYQFATMGAQQAPPEAPNFVEMATAHSVSFRATSTAIGTIIAPRSILLSNEVPGTVVATTLTPGAVVEAGTVLLQLDISIEQAQLEGAQAAVNIARFRFERTREAFQSKALTELELEEAKTQVLQAEARVSELRAVIAKKTLIAPFKARIGLSDTHTGQYLPSGTQITSLQSVEGYLYVDFTIPQSVAPSLQPGQSINLIAQGLPITATILALDSRTDKMTRNVMVRAKIDNAPTYLQPGDSVRVQIEYGDEIQAVAIPAEALRRTPEGALAFVAEDDGKGHLRATQRMVQVIKTIGSDVALMSGVKSGERVVTIGSFKLMPDSLLAESIEDPASVKPVSQKN